MPTLQLVAVICVPCRKGWHIKPEEAYELRKLGGLEWSELRILECPDCKGKLRRMPEYGEPALPMQGFWSVPPDTEWMS